MTSINFLPWRRDRRLQQYQRLLLCLGLHALMVLVLIVLINHAILSGIKKGQLRVQKLQTVLVHLQKEIAKKQALKRQTSVLRDQHKKLQALFEKNTRVFHLLEELHKFLPENVVLSRLTFANGSLLLEGMANSNQAISAVLHKIQANKWLKEARLTEIRGLGPGLTKTFHLRCRV